MSNLLRNHNKNIHERQYQKSAGTCFERISDFLNLKKLLNAACTSKQLQAAACTKLSDDYGKKHIIIHRYATFASGVLMDYDQIQVYRLELCLPFMRCFGSKIMHLRVKLGHRQSYAKQYINQYYANTLTSIVFRNPNRFLSTKKFKNIETLSIFNTGSRDELPSLVKWFPKLHHLNNPFGGVFFLDLEQITLHMDYMYENINFRAIIDPNARDKLIIQNAKNLLHANQQLSSVHIHSSRILLTMNMVLNMISRNPSILMLHVSSRATDVNTDEIKRLTSEHHSLVELSLTGFRIECDDVIFIMHQLGSLKKLSIDMKNRFECDRLLNLLTDNEWKHEYLSYFCDDVAYNGSIPITLKR